MYSFLVILGNMHTSNNVHMHTLLSMLIVCYIECTINYKKLNLRHLVTLTRTRLAAVRPVCPGDTVPPATTAFTPIIAAVRLTDSNITCIILLL